MGSRERQMNRLMTELVCGDEEQAHAWSLRTATR
jgi:hypothetical protein